jgi:hypothetical protein
LLGLVGVGRVNSANFKIEWPAMDTVILCLQIRQDT